LAARPNILVKVLGLCVVGAGWVLEANRGICWTWCDSRAERVMAGSNFPVDRMFIGYREMIGGYQRAVASLDHAQQRAIS